VPQRGAREEDPGVDTLSLYDIVNADLKEVGEEEGKGGKDIMANIAVAGAGYWGKNLVRNFYELGALKAICDKQKGLHAQYKEKHPGIT